jgi:putative copper export protein
MRKQGVADMTQQVGDALAVAQRPRRSLPTLRHAPAPWVLLSVLAVVAAGTAMAMAQPDPTVPGLQDSGPLNEYALRAVRALAEVSAVGTVGAVLALAVLVPGAVLASEPAEARRLGRVASRWSAGWALCSAALLVLTCAEVVGLDAFRLLRSGLLLDLVLPLPPARALLSTIAVAVVVAVWARTAATRAVTWQLLVLSLAGLVPPLLTSHTGHTQERGLALASLVVHVPTAALWFGGLAVLVLHLRGWTPALATGLRRFSRLAGGCFAVVAVSGGLSAWSRLPELDQLWTTSYGRLVVAKVVALAALGVFGAVHRARTLPAAASGRPRAVLRLAAGELVVLATAIGLAVALSTTAPPV